jgi:ElaB/YqjD/DUF883 family membrane-anchored ribosome-binding protein
MSYPTNELLTDLKRSVVCAELRPDTLICEEEIQHHGQRDKILSVLKRAKVSVADTNAMIHRNPYPALCIGIGAGALPGIAIARQLVMSRP